MIKRTFSLLMLTLAASSVWADGWTLDKMTKTGPDGKTVYVPKPIESKLKNPWPAEWEAAFQERARYVIQEQAKQRTGVNTYFENEKRGYGYLMAQVFSGKKDQALEYLQARDVQSGEWHKHTEGIDYFACFTIKHQTRKYFYFGDLLDPAYKKQMYDGAKKWTEKDPMRRHHYAWRKGQQGWGPNAKNSWVDVRTTENLSAMRWVAVYLFAEETGNRETTEKYKQQFITYAKALFRMSGGEWDSENYLGHTITPFHSLYDFAKDPEVQALAKAVLDWHYTAAAVKYYRGGVNGPTKRDYNHVAPFQPLASHCWLYFADTPMLPTHWESDEIHVITSSYRPPAAVINLAQKNFDRPTEIFASKASYNAPQEGKYGKPISHETQYFGKTFLMGSLFEGTDRDGGDTNGFKIHAWDKERGVSDIQAAPTSKPLLIGSPVYKQGVISARNRVAQNKDIAIWLTADGVSPWRFVLPKKVKVSEKNDVTFLEADKTYFALHPINLKIDGISAAETEGINFVTKGKGKKAKKREKWPDHQVITANGTGGNVSGFAIEIGEAPQYKSFDAFQKAVLSKSKLSVESSDTADMVQLTSAAGRSVGMHAGKGLSSKTSYVLRDGNKHDIAGVHAKVTYTDVDKGAEGLIHQDWLGDGTLTVRAGGAVFTGKVDEAGNYTFTNE